MKVLTNTWRELVRRRLWPVAVLLVALVAAVPLVLAEDPEPVPGPELSAPAVTAANASDPLAEPVVALAEPSDRSRRRRVLGARKDPFAPAPPPKPAKKAAKQATEVTEPEAPETEPKPEEPATGGGGSAPADPVAPVEPVEPEPKPRVFPADSLIVRFGDATTDDRPKQVLRKLSPLPEGDAVDAETVELLVYLGLTKDKKHAIFLVDASLETAGDGSCKPHPSSCETIHLSKGETEFFDVVDPETGVVTEQYQLDIVDIKTRDKK
jgi:hypothetical protein